MRAYVRLTTGILSVLAASLVSTPPALALPGPHPQQYWFSWWELEEKVWPITKGRGVTVAVIDNGVNATLPDLKGRVIRGTHVDPGTHRPRPVRDHGGHGTGIAALIAGQGAGTGTLGVAPEAKILPITTDLGLWDDGIRYAVDRGAEVINLSVGSATFHPCPDETQDAIAYALQRDVVVVVSAGNGKQFGDWTSQPANCAGVIAVGGLDGMVKPWEGTLAGDYVSLSAPAVGVRTVGWHGNVEIHKTGTSAAAGLTSGAVALVRARYPKMPAREVVQRITATAKDVGPAGWDDLTGYGLVRPYRALVDKVPATAPNPVYTRYDRWHASHERPLRGTTSASQEDKSIKTSDHDQDDGNVKWIEVLSGAATIILISICLRSDFIRRKNNDQAR